MKRKHRETIQIRACPDDFPAASDYIHAITKRGGVGDESTREAMLVFEALIHEMEEQGYGKDTTIGLSGDIRLGNVNIKLVFDGSMFIPGEGSADSPEGLILEGFSDRISYSYYKGQNKIVIALRRNFSNSLFYCSIATLLAFVAFAPFALFMDPAAQARLYESYLLPLEKLFTNAMLMVGAPMTFFSLVKNLTDTYVISERYSGLRELSVKTVVTSLAAIGLAVLTAFPIGHFIAMSQGTELVQPTSGLDRTFEETVAEYLPSNVFDAFGAISPIPLFIVALLVTYALCTTGKHFEPLKKAADASFALVSRMLHAVMALLPLFCFLAVLNVLFISGPLGYLLSVLILILPLVISICLIPLFATYAIRLRAHGVKVIPFAKTLMPLLVENFKIGSVIEATPFNIRYCARHFGASRSLLEKHMPALAQINLDGNAFLIMLLSLFSVFLNEPEITWLNIFGIGLLVLFLSFGAPNQPGSLLIGMLIVYMYLGIEGAVAPVILIEAFLGPIQNGINVIGDVVLAKELDANQRRASMSAPV